MIENIVLTTINQPTNCVKSWGLLQSGNILIVGDRKTPEDWKPYHKGKDIIKI